MPTRGNRGGFRRDPGSGALVHQPTRYPIDQRIGSSGGSGTGPPGPPGAQGPAGPPGTDGAAGGVASVAGGVGITNVPDPIISAGTVDLDIFSLTTEPAPASGDWFPFVDVSVGTAPADQRKGTIGSLATALNASLDHGALLGLGDDDHLQYVLLAGRAGGTTVFGSPLAGEGILFRSNPAADGVISFGSPGAMSINEAFGQIQFTLPAFFSNILFALGTIRGGVSSGDNLSLNSNSVFDGYVEFPEGRTIIGALAYTWPPSQAANTFLKNDGAGNLTWASVSGTGTVTSVAGGVGITNTPEPIVGAGTVDLDVNSLTTETTVSTGDLFAFVDVSVGTSPASQRKGTIGSLVTGINALLDHGTLAGLADDDHLQYALLAGRAGGQTLFGGVTTFEGLTILSNPGNDGLIALGSGIATLTVDNANNQTVVTGPSIFTNTNHAIGGVFYVWPGSDGSANYILKTNGSAVLSWSQVTAAEIAGGAAMTKVDDTNVTLALSANAPFSLLAATSLTLGWTGLLGLGRGGTNANLSATGGTSQVLKQTSVGAAVTVGQLSYSDLSGTLAHSALSGLTTGDDHTQYFKLLGRAGGQVGYGGTLSGNNLQFRSNPSNDGTVILGAGLVGTSVTVDQSTNLVWLTGTKIVIGPALTDIGGVSYIWPGANATGVLKNNGAGTLSWAAVAFSELTGTLAHSALSGLTTGDDHTQYLKLLGRAGGQVAYGGLNTGDHLDLFANDETWAPAEAGRIRMRNQVSFPEAWSPGNNVYLNLIEMAATYSLGTNFISIVNGLYFNPTLTYTGVQILSRCAAVYSKPLIKPVGAVADNVASWYGILSTPKYIPDTAASSTPRVVGVGAGPMGVPSAGASTIFIASAFQSFPSVWDDSAFFSNLITVNDLRHFECTDPADGGGGPTVTEQVGLFIPTFTRGTRKLSIRSAGNMEMRHAGAAVFGADAGVTNASVGLEVQSTTEAFLPSRMTRAQRNTLAGVAVANGMLLYDSDAATTTLRHNANWVETPGWDICISKIADQTVTNSTTLTDDTDLQWAVVANEAWFFELILALTGSNTTGDGKFQLLATANTFANSWRSGVYFDAAGALVTTLFTPAAFTSVTEMVVAGGLTILNGDATLFPLYFKGFFRASANATVKVQFANAAAASGRTTIMQQGSILRAKRMV